MAVQMRTMLAVADNSGARKLQVILPLGGGLGKKAGLGDVVTAAVKVPSMISATVRHTPLTAIDSPREVSWVEPRMVRRAPSPTCSIPATSPSSSTIPVNIRAFLLEAQPAVWLRGWRGHMRTRFSRPGLPAACVLPPIRTFTVGPGISPGQPTAGCGRVADFDRRLGVSPTPEHAYSYS